METSKNKIIRILGLICMVPSIASATSVGDFTALHGTNFMPTYNACGTHFEVDGNTLYSIAIINERLVPSQNAGHANCDIHRFCNGETKLFTCSDSICTGLDGSTITVLNDEKIIVYKKSTDSRFESVKSKNKSYYHCQ